jgi:hypothetical protein
MALTKKQELSLHQILEIPWVSSSYTLLPEDNLTAQKRESTNTSYQAKALLDAYIAANITTDTDVENALKTYLDRWAALGTDTTVIEAGSAGGAQGVTLDPQAERREIQRQVTTLVPFYRHHESIQLQDSGNKQISLTR